jgi:uncharacterized protein (TIGR02217 family)
MTVQIFPTLPGLGFPARRTPAHSTTSQVAWSGKDSRRKNWTYPKHRYELTFDFLRSDSLAEWQTLVGFFNKVGGSATAFKFLDPDDNAATAQQIGVGNGVDTQFQLVRTLGGYVEPVFSPISPVVSGAGLYSVNAAGLVTFNLPPTIGAALTWTGFFYWLCRFDEDELTFEKFNSTMWTVGKASFTTVKP